MWSYSYTDGQRADMFIHLSQSRLAMAAIEDIERKTTQERLQWLTLSVYEELLQRVLLQARRVGD